MRQIPVSLWIKGIEWSSAAVSGVLLFLSLLTLVLVPFHIHSLSKKIRPVQIPHYASLGIEAPENYLEKLKRHALFYVPEGLPVPEQGGVSDSAFQNFRLIGVIQGAQPGAVILNASNNSSYLVQPGESFNEIKVIEVLSRSALVEHNGIRKILPLQESA